MVIQMLLCTPLWPCGLPTFPPLPSPTLDDPMPSLGFQPPFSVTSTQQPEGLSSCLFLLPQDTVQVPLHAPEPCRPAPTHLSSLSLPSLLLTWDLLFPKYTGPSLTSRLLYPMPSAAFRAQYGDALPLEKPSEPLDGVGCLFGCPTIPHHSPDH